MESKEAKVINIETLLINRRREKNCKCAKPHYEIDTQNHLVYCQKCLAVVEPFEALLQIARYFEEINDSVEYAKEYRNELMNYKPYLREARRYEQMMKQKNMLPICPKCSQLFNWNEVVSMGNKRFYKEEGNDKI